MPSQHTSPQVSDVLDRAITRHGGMDRWKRIRAIEVDLTITGALFEVKGFPDPLTTSVWIDAQRPRSIMTPYRGGTSTGTFEPHRVATLNPDGSVIEQRDDPRASFANHVWTTPWDELHRLYFLGYAMWNYLSFPFLLAHEGFGLEALGQHAEDGETWDMLRATFPPEVPAHCPVQTFYFDADGVLKRIDYETDVAGGVATHYPLDPKPFDGLLVPTRRRVVQRLPSGPKAAGRTGVFLDYTAVRIHDH